MNITKNKVILALCIAFALSSCNKKEVPATAENIDNNRFELVHLWFEAFNNRDTVFLLNSYATDAVLEDPDNPWKPVKGNTAILQTYQRLFKYVPDVKDSVKSITVEENRAAVEFISTGSVGGSSFRMRIMTLLEFDEAGRIVRDATYYDRKEE